MGTLDSPKPKPFNVNSAALSMRPGVRAVAPVVLPLKKTAPAKPSPKAKSSVPIPRTAATMASSLSHSSTSDIHNMAATLQARAAKAKTSKSRERSSALATAAALAAKRRHDQHAKSVHAKPPAKPPTTSSTPAGPTGGSTPTTPPATSTGSTGTTPPAPTTPTVTPVTPQTTPAPTLPTSTQQPVTTANGLQGAFNTALQNATNPSMPSWYNDIINADNAQTTQEANTIQQIYANNYNTLQQQAQTASGEYADIAKAAGMAWTPGDTLPGQADISQIMNLTNGQMSGIGGTLSVGNMNNAAAEMLKQEPWTLGSLYGANATAQQKLAATYGTEIMKAMATGNTAALKAIEGIINNQNTNATSAANTAAKDATAQADTALNDQTKVQVQSMKGTITAANGQNKTYADVMKEITGLVNGSSSGGNPGHWQAAVKNAEGIIIQPAQWVGNPSALAKQYQNKPQAFFGAVENAMSGYQGLAPNQAYAIMLQQAQAAGFNKDQLNAYIFLNGNSAAAQASQVKSMMAATAKAVAQAKKTNNVKALLAQLVKIGWPKGGYGINAIAHALG